MPNSFSGKLVAIAYWLFVVLTVNTFTANLAAFLTVERMVSTGEVAPQSLEEMINEPGINFTVRRYLMIFWRNSIVFNFGFVR